MNSLGYFPIFVIVSVFLPLFAEGKCKAKGPCQWVKDECYTNAKNTIARCTPGRNCKRYEYLRRANVCPQGFKVHKTAHCSGKKENKKNYRHFCCKEDKNYTVTGLPYMTPLDYENARDITKFPDIVEDGIPLPHEPIPFPGDKKSVYNTQGAWPNAEIPYYVNYSLAGWDEQTRAEITKAIDEYETHTCLTFHAAVFDDDDDDNNDKNWVSIENDPVVNTNTNCGLSQICGPVGGRQFCSVGPPCTNAEWLVHELGHSLCFDHEHQREDRDTYIYFNSDVCTADSYPLDYSPTWSTQDIPFDFDSIMMYPGCRPGYCFQRQPGQGEGPCGEAGDGSGRLSQTDIIRVNKFHKCDCDQYKCE